MGGGGQRCLGSDFKGHCQIKYYIEIKILYFSPPPEPPPSVPADLETYTNITINNQTFIIEADDLEVLTELGKGFLLITV